MEFFIPQIQQQIQSLEKTILSLKGAIQDLIKVISNPNDKAIISTQLAKLQEDYQGLQKKKNHCPAEFYLPSLKKIYQSLLYVHHNLRHRYSVNLHQPLETLSSYLGNNLSDDIRETPSDEQQEFIEDLLDDVHDGEQGKVIQTLQSLQDPLLLDKLLNTPIQMDESLLMLACEWGDQQLVRFLVQHPLMTHEGINLENEEGDSAFSLACKEENLATLSLLLSSQSVMLNSLIESGNQGFSLLHQLVERGCRKTLEFLLKNQLGNFNIQDSEGYTPFFVACEEQDKQLMTLFLSYSQQVNANLANNKGYSPLHSLCEKGKSVLIQEMLKYDQVRVNAQDKRRQSPIFFALYSMHSQSLKTLLKDSRVELERCNIQGVSPLKLAVWKGFDELFITMRPETKERIEKEKQQSLPFHSSKEELYWLVKKNTHLKLFQDLYLENFSEIEKLIEKPLEKDILNAIDSWGNSVLSYLILHQKASLVLKFVQHPQFLPELLKLHNSEGYSPLHLACQEGDTEVLRALLIHSSFDTEGINQLDADGESPLTLLCKKKQEEAIDLLLQVPYLNPDLCNAQGQSPRQLAERYGLNTVTAYYQTRDKF